VAACLGGDGRGGLGSGEARRVSEREHVRELSRGRERQQVTSLHPHAPPHLWQTASARIVYHTVEYDPRLDECFIRTARSEGEFCIDNLLVRIHFIIVMIRWTGRRVSEREHVCELRATARMVHHTWQL